MYCNPPYIILGLKDTLDLSIFSLMIPYSK